MKRLSITHRFAGIILAGIIPFACATPGTEAPSWPEQPSPSYPRLTDNAESAPPADFDSSKPEPSDSPAPVSSLAKKFDGKKALDTLKGKATYYSDSLAGNHTANGDIYDPGAFTAAHKKLKFGTIVRVVREDTGATTYVRINDRGPFGAAERIIDLSKVAAQQLDMMKAGVVAVRVEIVELPESK